MDSETAFDDPSLSGRGGSESLKRRSRDDEPREQIKVHQACEDENAGACDYSRLLARKETSDVEGFKNCKWSPDGYCLLTCKDDRVRLFELPRLSSDADEDQPERLSRNERESQSTVNELSEMVSAKEGESVYDYAWYPGMDSSNPVTCCFASLCRAHPVHLWDAYESQKLRASYTLENESNEPVWGLSLGLTETKVFCGLKSAVYLTTNGVAGIVWDLERPGRPIERRRTNKGRDGSQAGINGLISSFAFSPDNHNVFSVGSYSGQIATYSQENNRVVFHAKAQRSGVTQVTYSQCGRFLWAGGRRSSELLCWDLRAGSNSAPYWRVPRVCKSNQHIQFDIVDHDEQMGCPLVLSGHSIGSEIECFALRGDQPERVFMQIDDCLSKNGCIVNGVSVNPWNGQLAASTGQRITPSLKLAEDDEDYLAQPMHSEAETRTGGLYVLQRRILV